MLTAKWPTDISISARHALGMTLLNDTETRRPESASKHMNAGEPKTRVAEHLQSCTKSNADIAILGKTERGEYLVVQYRKGLWCGSLVNNVAGKRKRTTQIIGSLSWLGGFVSSITGRHTDKK